MATPIVDVPYIASYCSIPASTLSTLAENPTADLVKNLLESITTKAREHEELKADKLRLDVELENALRGSDSKVKSLKTSVQKKQTEIDSLRTNLQESGKAPPARTTN